MERIHADGDASSESRGQREVVSAMRSPSHVSVHVGLLVINSEIRKIFSCAEWAFGEDLIHKSARLRFEMCISSNHSVTLRAPCCRPPQRFCQYLIYGVYALDLNIYCVGCYII